MDHYHQVHVLKNVSGISHLTYMHYQFRGLDCIGTHCPDLISCTTELSMSLVGMSRFCQQNF